MNRKRWPHSPQYLSGPALNARRVHTGTTTPPELTSHKRYRLDDAVEWALSARGRENLALAVGAAACIGLIIVLGR